MTADSLNNLFNFNLLSIGQRGVGKTVFLAGSYAQFTDSNKNDNPDLWIECSQERDRENLEAILNYIDKKQQYPPATFKISNFNFLLKQKKWQKKQPIARFQWFDIPGEVCNFNDPAFQDMTLNSHGCCVFINAFRLLKEPDYERDLEPIIKQVGAIASLVKQKQQKYPIAIVFTQCDRLEDREEIIHLQLEEKLPRLITFLDSQKTSYRRFYSSIPLQKTATGCRLEPRGTIDAFFWLILSLKKQSNFTNLGSLLQENVIKLKLAKSPRKKTILTGVLAIVLGAFGLVVMALELVKKDENLIINQNSKIQSLAELTEIANKNIENEQYQQAIPIIQEIIKQQPEEASWRLTLAKMYSLSGEYDRGEKIFDRLLATDKNNLQALMGKALSRQLQGDNEGARELYERAEKIAPDDLKGEIRKRLDRLP